METRGGKRRTSGYQTRKSGVPLKYRDHLHVKLSGRAVRVLSELESAQLQAHVRKVRLARSSSQPPPKPLHFDLWKFVTVPERK